MLLSSNLPQSLCAEAVAYNVYIPNQVLSSAAKVTPFEAWNGRRPDVSNIRIFGSRAFVRCPNTKKLDARSEEGAFVGISDTQKAYPSKNVGPKVGSFVAVFRKLPSLMEVFVVDFQVKNSE